MALGYRHHPDVAAVLARFPGAEIVDLRGELRDVVPAQFKLPCGAITFWDRDSQAGYRCLECFCVVGSVGQPHACRRYADEPIVSTDAPPAATEPERGELAASPVPRGARGGEHASIGAKVAYVKAQGQTRDHHCHWPGCAEQVPPAVWGCKRHWFMLPKSLRDRIWQTFRPGQETNWTPSRAYVDAARDVQLWIAADHQTNSAEADNAAALRESDGRTTVRDASPSPNPPDLFQGEFGP